MTPLYLASAMLLGLFAGTYLHAAYIAIGSKAAARPKQATICAAMIWAGVTLAAGMLL
jgi:hypothetical protein